VGGTIERVFPYACYDNPYGGSVYNTKKKAMPVSTVESITEWLEASMELEHGLCATKGYILEPMKITDVFCDSLTRDNEGLERQHRWTGPPSSSHLHRRHNLHFLLLDDTKAEAIWGSAELLRLMMACCHGTVKTVDDYYKSDYMRQYKASSLTIVITDSEVPPSMVTELDEAELKWESWTTSQMKAKMKLPGLDESQRSADSSTSEFRPPLCQLALRLAEGSETDDDTHDLISALSSKSTSQVSIHGFWPESDHGTADAVMRKRDKSGFVGHEIIAATVVTTSALHSIIGVSDAGDLIHGTNGEIIYSCEANGGVRAIDVSSENLSDSWRFNHRRQSGIAVLILEDGSFRVFEVSRDQEATISISERQWVHAASCDISETEPIVGNRYQKKREDYDCCEEEFQKLSESQKKSYMRIERPGGPKIDMATGKQKKKASVDLGKVTSVKIIGRGHALNSIVLALTDTGLWGMDVTEEGMMEPYYIVEQEGIKEFDVMKTVDSPVIYFIDSEGRLNSFIDDHHFVSNNKALFGRLLGDDDESLNMPHVVTVGSSSARIVDVACGTEHVVAVCDDGSVFTWGMDTRQKTRSGKLATRDGADSVLPRIVFVGSEELQAEKCYAHDTCSMIMTSDYRLMSAGVCEARVGAKTSSRVQYWNEFTEMDLPAHASHAEQNRFPVAVDLKSCSCMVLYQQFEVDDDGSEDEDEPMEEEEEEDVEETPAKKAKVMVEQETIYDFQQELDCLQLLVKSMPWKLTATMRGDFQSKMDACVSRVKDAAVQERQKPAKKSKAKTSKAKARRK